MSPERIAVYVVVFLVFVLFVFNVYRKIPKRLKTRNYVKKWRDIQKLFSNKEDWAHAIVHADMLLDEVMCRKKINGKTMGERLVNIQDRFSVHESVWNAHKLAGAIRQEGSRQMSEEEVKNTLVAFRQALRDLGAL